ncbi:putative quinol monooxygenase [Pseudohalioglobus lutimaris]|uniref:ABM domain-containing protein n=1 Tax=Pseudohalioglobus lutimaris TaxID=1737061 RepID=A0A2N5X5S0_9GAMM|nr:putative quinol monooxygenase [Pseudohalioglobus lutimaris]PLW69835.1 hypothetical protein C0039_04690 [Pseudohalioglobus lutimaris]
MFAYLTHVRARPGKREALMDANIRMQSATLQEEGVPVYIFHTSEENPDEFYYYDLYQSEEAYLEHCQTEAFQQMIGCIGELADVLEMKKLLPFGVVKSQPISTTV